jgi:hypothetical protein
MSDDNDPESISFIGFQDLPPAHVEIDFNQDVYLVEFFFWNDVKMISVNAKSEEQAISLAVEKLLEAGINAYKVEKVRTSKLEVIDDGNAELA